MCIFCKTKTPPFDFHFCIKMTIKWVGFVCKMRLKLGVNLSVKRSKNGLYLVEISAQNGLYGYE